MVVTNNQIFNLMDTNGRRSDVLNALKIYLEILEELKEEYPTEVWGAYPDSVAQFVFYEKAIEKSKDVFKKHTNYDKFINDINNHYQNFLKKDSKWIDANFSKFKISLDKGIETRSRHYTSNLVRIGFTDIKRNITESGYAYLRGLVDRDAIEDFLPLDNINIVLLRQLLKLKIFSTPNEDGIRTYYSPFYMALYLLLGDDDIDEHTFKIIVQGLNPYMGDSLKEAISNGSITIEDVEMAVRNIDVEVPEDLYNDELDINLFGQYFSSSKSVDSTVSKYYNFFTLLNNFLNERNETNYNKLIKCFEDNNDILSKAFGYGRAVFNIGIKGHRYNLKTFIEKNSDHPLLCTKDYIKDIYSAFINSKWIDGVKEYSDTTVRLLKATGLFKFKNLPELSYREVLSTIFNDELIRNNIFGEMTEENYLKYEIEDNCYFCKNISISDILGYSTEDVQHIIESIEKQFGVSKATDVKALLNSKKNTEFINHINDKYPKEKIMEILPLFSDRRNDNKIKNEVNDAASVPTIYEYIIGIAWYYISNKEFDLYESLNLTLNADFEPVIHAGGGEGDIVISYADIVVMLEVTLMNKNAQKKGEWEPVLRHSLNLKADNEDKDTITFFIADELDYNTVNIWRAVAAASLESTNTHKTIDGVVIMPFTNEDILNFLEKNVTHTQIIDEVKMSFAKVPRIFDAAWHNEVIQNLLV